jgi:hypothetical protein
VYGQLIRSAKSAAQSWGDRQAFDKLNEIDSIRAQVIQRTACEQWMINPSVHYSKWHEFSVDDFTPIVEAFRDCFGLFQCQNCGGLIHLTEKNKEPIGVRCPCQNVNWNLQRKHKAQQ